MDVTIKKVSTSRELKQFISFPYKLYKNNSYWVPPLISDEVKSLSREKNPAFEFCEAEYWLAYKNGKISGRIAGIINHRYNEKWKQRTARLGWFDFIDDEQTAAALLQQVENWAALKGMTCIHGPLGFTDMDAAGILIEGYNEISTFGASYNYPYYSQHIEKCGYKKDMDWIEYQVTMDSEIIGKISRIADIALERNKLKVLKVKKSKEILPYGKEIFAVLNNAYKDLYGFVELSEKQIDTYIKQYFGFIIPEYVPVVLDSDNRVAAFGITMPSMSKAMQKNRGHLFPFGFIHMLKAMKKNDHVDLYLTAVRPDLQNKGVNAILINEMNKVFVKNKITKVETNRELEVNTKVQAQWRFFEHRQHKRRRCFKKELSVIV